MAAVWGSTVLKLEQLRPGVSFRLGETEGAAFPVPDGVDAPEEPVRAVQNGWELDPRGVWGGLVVLRGRREDASALARAGAPVPIMPGDYGILQYGLFSVFFQYATPVAQVPGSFSIEGLALLALLSSGLFHIGTLFLLRSLMTPPQKPKPYELENAASLAERFGLKRALVEEPPPEPAKGTDEGGKPLAAQDKTPKGGGQKMKGDEGKLGMKAKADATELPGDVKPAANLGGLSDVINSEVGSEIKKTLNSIQTVSAALGGLNSQNLVLGSGPGASLRGAGSGGGGRDDGVPFGAGTLQTGWGAGVGGGLGSGAGGRGGRGGGAGAGGGRGGGAGGPAEAKVSVGAGAPTARGGLAAEQIRRVVMAHQGALRACYESEAQRNPNLRGGITLQWSIEPGGSVSSASVVQSSLGNPRVEGCVLRQVKSWRFPQADASSKVDAYPFKFGIGG